MEFGLKSFPSLLFFILGTVRFFEIKDYAINAYKFSKFFMTKCAISITMGLANTLYIIICYAVQPESLQSWINKCDDDNFSLFYGVQALAWFLSTALMVIEYKRGLSEAWYSNQMFWSSNLLFQIITVSVCHKYYSQNGFMISACCFNLLGNLTLVVLLLRTASRTERFKRPYVEQDERDFATSFK